MMGKPSRFWNFIARRYARMPVQDEATYREKLARTQSYLRPDWEVLEIGCGTGSTALEHAPHVGRIRAIDSSPKMIEICREKAAGTENVRFDLAALDDLDVGDNSVDAVLAMSLLHLLDNRDAAIRRVHSMLRPGGIFVSSTSCVAGMDNVFIRYLLPAGAALGLLPRIARFSRSELRRSMEDAGFQIEQDWLPHDNPAKAVFMVARKPELPAS